MNTSKLEVRAVARFCRALGDETRARIVALLSHGALCVCHLQAVLGVPQSNVSRHLAVLRAAGVVEDRRSGSWIYYRLRPQEDPACDRQLKALVAAFGGSESLRREVARVAKRLGPGACS